MKKTQRWLCLLLVLCMMVSVLPVTAAGAEALADVIKRLDMGNSRLCRR